MNEGAVLIAVTVVHVFVVGALFAAFGWYFRRFSNDPKKAILGGAIQGGFIGPIIYFAPGIQNRIIPEARFFEDLVSTLFISIAIFIIVLGVLRRLPLIGPLVRAFIDAEAAREAYLVRRHNEDLEHYRKKYG